MINWAFVLTLLVTSNCMLTNGFGVLSLQRSKNNMWFTLVNCSFMALTIVGGACVYRLVYGLLAEYDMQNLGLMVIVVLCGAFGFISMQLVKLFSKEMYYYYDTTYSFVVNLGTSIGVLLCLDYSANFAVLALSSVMAAVAYIVVSVIFSFNYYRLANKRISRRVRPVPIAILTVAILSMIIYAISVSL